AFARNVRAGPVGRKQGHPAYTVVAHRCTARAYPQAAGLSGDLVAPEEGNRRFAARSSTGMDTRRITADSVPRFPATARRWRRVRVPNLGPAARAGGRPGR